MSYSYKTKNPQRRFYRDRYLILYHILLVSKPKPKDVEIKNKNSRTRISYSCNLLSRQARECIDLLVETQLLAWDDIQGYYTTNKGLRYMDIIRIIKDMISIDTEHLIFPDNIDYIF